MRYQYANEGLQPYNSITPSVKLLLIINIIVFILCEISGIQYELFYKNFGLVPEYFWNHFMLWQPFTYLFLHGGYIHLIFNMLVLWMFGKDLEINWGNKEFLKYYFVCGIGSGFITSLFDWGSYVPVIGASGAIYGLLLAFGVMYPNKTVYLYAIFPIKVKFMVLLLAIIAFFASMTSIDSTVSHVTHLSGMFVGFIYLKYKVHFKYFRLWLINKKMDKLNIIIDKSKKNDFVNKKRVDKILEKINLKGWETLTKEEQQVLHKASKMYSKNNHPN